MQFSFGPDTDSLVNPKAPLDLSQIREYSRLEAGAARVEDFDRVVGDVSKGVYMRTKHEGLPSEGEFGK